ncbi:MAG TPA: radical SAM protein [Polyangia bacterium]|jgi:cyclic pyranopterin phosphate synthase
MTGPRGGARGERLHINLGAVCNNNCLFCQEGDRAARLRNNSAMTSERVRWMLESHRGAEEVCFTSGEPTTNPRLLDFVRWARALGYPRISLMSNGRRLAYRAYASRLVRAGLNRVCLSVHGDTAELHDGLTRTPGSFEQTVAGLGAVARLKGPGLDLHTSTVVTVRNLPALAEVYRFLRDRGVDQVVFNALQPCGRAATLFEQIAPRYSVVADRFRDFVARLGTGPVMAFLVDVPLCVTEGLPELNRGYVERYFHYDLAAHAAVLAARKPDRQAVGEGAGLALVRRGDLDAVARSKRPACDGCRYTSGCPGVWDHYVAHYGWHEFVPVQ